MAIHWHAGMECAAKDSRPGLLAEAQSVAGHFQLCALDLKERDMLRTPVAAGLHRLHENLAEPKRVTRLVLRLALIAVGLVVIAWLGRDLAVHLPAIEKWIADLGFWGPVVFVVLVAVCTMVFLPDTPFAIAGGVVFGLWWGTMLLTIAAFINAALTYCLSRNLLRGQVEKWLERSPKLAAIQRAASHQGVRFLLLLRLTPVSAVAVSNLLGAAGIRFAPFIIACVGLIPGLFVEVYLGSIAKHVTKTAGGVSAASTTETSIRIAGLLVCFIVLALITRAARKALSECDESLDPAVGDSNSA